MRSFWSEPFLWIHLAGLAVLPIFLELCLLGLAVGDPLLPPWLELFLVAAIGVLPIAWMQWQRPFYIFSVVAVAVKPEQLTLDQRRILRLFKQPENRMLVIVGALLLALVLRQLYYIAPIAADVAPFPSELRLAGLLLASVSFLASNLFLLVPLFVLRVLVANDAAFSAIEPYPTEQIRSSFSILGLQLNQILPTFQVEPTPSAELTATSVPSGSLAQNSEAQNSEPQSSEPSVSTPSDDSSTAPESSPTAPDSSQIQ